MNDIPQPKFNIGMLVNYTKETGCILPGGKAEIIVMKYDTDVKICIYHIQNEHIGKVKAHTVGEIWIQLVEPNSEIECIKYAVAAHDKEYWVVVSNEDEKYISPKNTNTALCLYFNRRSQLQTGLQSQRENWL